MERLKRGREQLLDPIARLDGLLRDGQSLAQMTAASIEPELGPAVNSNREDEDRPARPAWLTQDFLGEGTDALLGRVRELADGLQAGLSQRTAQEGQNDSASSPQLGPSQEQPSAEDNPAQQAAEKRLLENLERSVPLLENAAADLSAARSALDNNNNQQSLNSHGKALEAIAQARELFLDLRRLVELVYMGTATLTELLNAAQSGANEDADDTSRLGALRDLSAKNLARSERLGPMITDEKAALQLAAQAPQANPLGPNQSALNSAQEERNPQIARLEKAYEHWGNAQRSLFELQSKLGTEDADKPATALADAVPDLQSAQRELEALRRLFFNLIEHLQDTARQQQELGDRTESLLSEPAAANQAPAQNQAQADAQAATAPTPPATAQDATKPSTPSCSRARSHSFRAATTWRIHTRTCERAGTTSDPSAKPRSQCPRHHG